MDLMCGTLRSKTEAVAEEDYDAKASIMRPYEHRQSSMEAEDVMMRDDERGASPLSHLWSA